MRIIFMGTPKPAADILELLVKEKYEIVLVVTQPDRPQGRGQKVAFSAVKEIALKYGLPVEQSLNLKIKERPDLIIVVAYGKILPKEIIDLPKLGCLNLHASLLPKYRGAAPIQRALVNGDLETGITMMKIDEGLDTGDIVAQKKVEIGPNDNAVDLFEKLFAIGGDLLLKVLHETEERMNLRTYEQDDALATYAPTIKKELGEIDWQRPATEIHNLIRGLVVWPTAHTTYKGTLLKIIKSELPNSNENPISNFQAGPGVIVELKKKIGFVVSTGDGNLLIKEVQLAGKKKMSAYDFALGAHLKIGEILSK